MWIATNLFEFWCEWDVNYDQKVGRRGLVGLFTTHGAKGRGIEFRSFSFFYSTDGRAHPSALGETNYFYFYFLFFGETNYYSGDENWQDNVERENAGAAIDETNRGRKTGRRFRNGYEKGFRFVSKTIKWWTPIKGMTWREN